MSNTAEKTVTIGPGFLGLLTITFVILKATGYLAWSWWWVFSPLWLPFAFIITVLGLLGALLGGAELLDHIRQKRRQRASKLRAKK